mgnify:CR=1 FL=1
MGIQVKAVERNISFEKGKEEFAYVMQRVTTTCWMQTRSCNKLLS